MVTNQKLPNQIRPESPADHQKIHAVVSAAFGRADEARLVDLIRQRDQALVSLVAEIDGEVVGHVMISPVTVSSQSAQAYGGLAPLSVLPSSQHQGVGSDLMRQAIASAKDLGLAALFLLGHPGYYPRFGFQASHIDNEYGATDAFMHLELVRGSLNGVAGVAKYVDAFAELGA